MQLISNASALATVGVSSVAGFWIGLLGQSTSGETSMVLEAAKGGSTLIVAIILFRLLGMFDKYRAEVREDSKQMAEAIKDAAEKLGSLGEIFRSSEMRNFEFQRQAQAHFERVDFRLSALDSRISSVTGGVQTPFPPTPPPSQSGGGTPH